MSSFPVRRTLESELKSIRDPVAIALSGGPDSLSVLFALLELGKDVRAYTFAVKGTDSSDLRTARAVCKQFDVPHTEVQLPTSLTQIKEDTYALIRSLGLTAKTDIECMWPRWYLLREVDEQRLVTGDCCDAHFANSKRGAMHHSDSVEKMNQYRDEHFSDPNYAQLRTIRRIAPKYGVKTVIAPYRRTPFRTMFYDTSWDEVNTPRKKQPILDAYPERFGAISVNSANLQCGDSKIQDQFDQLVDSTWNIRDWKTPVGIYNAIARGEVPP